MSQLETTWLRAAIAPFAEVAAHMLSNVIPPGIQEDDSTPVWGGDEHAGEPVVTVGDLKRAASFVAKLETPSDK